MGDERRQRKNEKWSPGEKKERDQVWERAWCPTWEQVQVAHTPRPHCEFRRKRGDETENEEERRDYEEDDGQDDGRGGKKVTTMKELYKSEMAVKEAAVTEEMLAAEKVEAAKEAETRILEEVKMAEHSLAEMVDAALAKSLGEKMRAGGGE